MSFALNPKFVKGYASKSSPFGFNGLGEVVFRRTYSRSTKEGTPEEWHQCVERVVNGVFRMQERWIISQGLKWIEAKAQKTAQAMYDRIFTMKFLPPGRGLWAMGSEITEERKLFAALNNCAFVSTADSDVDVCKPFTFLMDMAMLGVGVGYDTKGAGKVFVRTPLLNPGQTHVVEDSREGWVEALRLLIDPYFNLSAPTTYDFSKIRPYGTPIKGFGGVASGPAPLMELLLQVERTLDRNVGSPLTVRTIVDIFNLIACCVIAGNVRRTAEIAFGDPESKEFLNLKNYKVNPERQDYGWSSNNSVFCEVGKTDYSKLTETIKTNGEPGFAWLRNMREFSRMGAPEGDWKDDKVQGGNPCLEQSLESFELCCLVETFPDNHSSFEDYRTTLKYAYMYAKTVTLGGTHWPETNRVMLRNRRIGCSVSGIAQFIAKRGLDELREWLTYGYRGLEYYDKVYSDWLCIPRSVKMTSVKPSGTVSLLAGATPGMHYPESNFYIRRVRMSKDSALVSELWKRGFSMELSVTDPGTMVVSFPVSVGKAVRTISQVSMWEQLALAAFLQKYWADNQVSCTVTFTPEEGDQIAHALEFYQYQLKGISFLPKMTGSYAQMPYEAITEEMYHTLVDQIRDFETMMRGVPVEAKDQEREMFCDGETCTVADTSSGVDRNGGPKVESMD